MARGTRSGKLRSGATVWLPSRYAIVVKHENGIVTVRHGNGRLGEFRREELATVPSPWQAASRPQRKGGHG